MIPVTVLDIKKCKALITHEQSKVGEAVRVQDAADLIELLRTESRLTQDQLVFLCELETPMIGVHPTSLEVYLTVVSGRGDQETAEMLLLVVRNVLGFL